MIEIEYYELGELADVTKLAGFEFTKYIKYNNYGEISINPLSVINYATNLFEQ